jgi:decaprenyl-phosphate phosphoribosyltransferase
LKNVLVAAAPLAAGILFQWSTIIDVLITFAIFCAASSGVYLVNDLLDVESDRAHPKKKFRPIASGEVKPPVAIAMASILLVAAPIVAWLLFGWPLATVMLVYEGVQIAYCIWLKHVVVVDLVVVSSGFLLRAVAGAVAVGVSTSQWFLLVMSFGSLFMVAGKRYAEKLAHEDGGATRRSLVGYSLSYLRFVWSCAAGLALISYSLWAFELGNATATIWSTLSIVPFGLAIFRYAYSVDKGVAGAPEDTVLEDKQLLVFALIWVALFAVAAFAR